MCALGGWQRVRASESDRAVKSINWDHKPFSAFPLFFRLPSFGLHSQLSQSVCVVYVQRQAKRSRILCHTLLASGLGQGYRNGDG